jgi:hypothetical protein
MRVAPKFIPALVLCVVLARAGLAEDGPVLPAGDDVSFRNDVMAVLSKAGCNAGGCHGNKNGKGGLKLSFRGQDPQDDFATFTRDLLGRRVNVLDPDASLMLLKPTGQMPHEGGIRFRRDSREYAILRRWIENRVPPDSASTPSLVGLEVSPSQKVLIEPEDHVRINATAVFSDGSKRDVSSLAVYEQSVEMAGISPDGLVRRQRDGETTVIVRYLHLQQPVRLAFIPARPQFQWSAPSPANYIDRHVQAKLRTLRINPSGPCTDGEFLRRAYLDLLGILPTPEEAQEFVSDPSSDKRARLVDQLLARPEYADHWALKWSDLLKNEERALDRKGVQSFHRWIRQSIADNKPLDDFVRELVSARGSTYSNPAANYYRANRDAVTRGEATAQLFLGVRLQCAQCHNHPFDRWTQDDYYGWADVFSRVDYKVLENRRRDTNDSHEFVGEQIVYEAREGRMKDPRGDRGVKARLLGEAEAFKDEQERLDALGEWITSPRNPFFARAQVNRIWYHLMGRGLIDPIDDFRPTNPPSHPELLDALAKDFVDHGYDVRYLIRLIMASQAYGASAEPNETNADDEVNYSRAVPRRLSAEQLLDAMYQVTGVPPEFAGYPRGMRAGQIPGVRAVRPRERKPSMGDMFLVSFGKPPRQSVCECERSTETTLLQTFQLIGGPEITRLIGEPDNRLSRLLKQGGSEESMIDELYWAALSRPLTPEEGEAMARHVREAKDKRKALEDVAWALLNAKEFVLRR